MRTFLTAMLLATAALAAPLREMPSYNTFVGCVFHSGEVLGTGAGSSGVRDLSPTETHLPFGLITVPTTGGPDGGSYLDFGATANDYAEAGVSDWRPSDTEAAFFCWLNTTNDQVIWSSADESNDNTYNMVQVVGGAVRVAARQDGGGFTGAVTDDTSFADGEWHFVWIDVASSAWSIYVDGELEAITGIGSNDGRWTGNITGRDNVMLNGLDRLTPRVANPLKAAKIQIYSRRLGTNSMNRFYHQGRIGSTAGVARDWPAGSYDHRITMTTDTNVIDGTVSDMPVLMKFSDASGVTTSDVSHLFDTVGTNWGLCEIYMSDNETKLYGEIEKWDGTNAWVWCEPVEMYANTPVTVSLYYGSGAGASTHLGGVGSATATNVWDNYVSVAHMAAAPSFDIADSADLSNWYNISTNGVVTIETEGYVANCVSNSANGIGLSELSGLVNGAGAASYSCWILPAAFSASDGIFASRGTKLNGVVYPSADVTRPNIRFDSSSTAGPTDSLSIGTWAHVVGTYDGATAMTYVDGEPVHTNTFSVAPLLDDDVTRFFRDGLDASRTFNGSIDEARLITEATPAAAVKLDYNSQTDNLFTYTKEDK